MIESREHVIGTIEKKVHDNLSLKQDFEIFDQGILDRLEDDLWRHEDAVAYLRGRGFSDLTLRNFHLGYSVKQDMVIVPMHDLKGKPLGFIGRSIQGKAFKNSDGLPKSETLFNIHRARNTGAESVIVCESSFDVMRLHQAGFANAVAILGDGFNDKLAAQISRTFSTVIIMTDDDDVASHHGKNPGEILGLSIQNTLSNQMVQWAHSGLNTRFPPGIKDIGDMDDAMIRQCVTGAVYAWEYQVDQSVV
jgi:DNA primase